MSFNDLNRKTNQFKIQKLFFYFQKNSNFELYNYSIQ